MPPNSASTSAENNTTTEEPKTNDVVGYLEKDTTYDPKKEVTNDNYKLEIVWSNVIYMGMLHILGLYGFFLMFTEAKWQTNVFAILLAEIGSFGITAGAHRLWTHKSYKAKLPLRILLAVLNTVSSQNHIYEWVRDHRVHHKFSETDADPHNANRGFFFSHVGWLLCRKHPEVVRKGKTIDMSDLDADPVVVFQRWVYSPASFLCAFLIPCMVPNYFWGEYFWTAFFIATCFRYVLSLNFAWTVNSLAHMYGNKPYDINIQPTDNFLVEVFANGEGFHNYHHTFPWDYSTSEFFWKINLTTIFIDFFAAIGWAYDLKKASPEMIIKRKQRTGILAKEQ